MMYSRPYYLAGHRVLLTQYSFVEQIRATTVYFWGWIINS